MRRRKLSTTFGSALFTLALISGTAGSASGAVSEHATPAKAALTPLQQGLKFYAGKTLTWVAPTSAGSTFDVSIRIIAPYVAKYLGAAAVNVFDDSGGNSITGSDYLAAQPPTGLVFGLIETGNIVGDIVGGLPGPNFNPERETFVGAIPRPNCTSINLKPSGPFTTFASIIAATPSNPVTEITEPNGDTNIAQRLFNRAFGINAKLITGYSTSNQLLQGFQRGDGALLVNNASAMIASVQAHQAVPVGVMVPCPVGATVTSTVQGVPDYAALFKKYPAKTKNETAARNFLFATINLPTEPLVTQARVPADEVDALRYALKKAEQNPNCKSQLNASGNPYGWSSADAAKSGYIEYLKEEPKIFRFLGLPVAATSI